MLQCEQDMSDGRETCCSVSRICQMEGRRGDVEISPSHFSSDESAPREVDGLSQMWPLPGVSSRFKIQKTFLSV